MSFTLHGIPVSSGIAIGRAHLITAVALNVSHYKIDANQVEAETARFETAVKGVQDELKTLHTSLNTSAPGDLGAFIDLHWMILSDPKIGRAHV